MNQNTNQQPIIRIETITPERASAILAEHQNIRPVRVNHVKKLTQLMRHGKWELNGETVKFDDRGVLIDGQHRLHAIAASGIAQKMVCVYGVTSRGVDEGCIRTLADLLPIAQTGGGNRNATAAIARLHYVLRTGQDPFTASRPSTQDIVLGSDPELWSIYSEAARQCAHQKIIKPASIGLVMAEVMSKGGDFSPFLSEVIKGISLTETMPAYWLRVWGETNRGRRDSRDWSRQCFIVTVRAWNAWVREVPMTMRGLTSRMNDGDLPSVLV